MRMQYTIAGTMGASPSVLTVTIASSSSASPSRMLPCRRRARPWRLLASATRSGSPNSSPIRAASVAQSNAASHSFWARWCIVSGIRRYARTAHGFPSRSSSRSTRANQPLA